MGRYSLEPPRTDLVAYHSFDTSSLDRVIDESPQQNDGKIVGDVELGVPGVVGSAAKLKNEDSNVVVSGLDEFLPLDEMTVSSWAHSRDDILPSNWVLRCTIEDGSGSTYTLEHVSQDTTDGWMFGAVTYDGETARLHYAEVGEGEPSVVDEMRLSVDVYQFSLEFHISFEGRVDDARVYRVGHDAATVDDLWRLGVGHPIGDDVKANWTSSGMPIVEGEGNYRLASTVASGLEQTRRDLDFLLDARHINTAAGYELDRIANGFPGISRQTNESDDHFRLRIKTEMVAGRSKATGDDLIEKIATVLDTDIEDVEIQPGWVVGTNPAQVDVFIDAVTLAESPMTTAELEDAFDDMVPAGHRLTVSQLGSDPFTLITDADTSNAANGLTSDSISTGGGLGG